MAKVVCSLCPHGCCLDDGQVGLCRARYARGGQVVDGNYGRITSLALDPIEKKPLARFRPGSYVLSVGSYGCNLRCPFCQNAAIACAGADDVSWRAMAPADLVAMAEATKADGGIGLAYTYNEPFVGFEFLRDCAQRAHSRGLANVVVSNGMVNPEPLSQVLSLIDAANIDLKGWGQGAYDQLGGSFDTVRHTIAAMAACPTCHLEVTTLVVPGMNDSEDAMRAMASWLSSLDPDIPYHVTRFFPCHRMADALPTAVEDVYRLASIAREYLRDVHVGNC